MTQQLIERETRKANKHVKRCSNSLVIREILINKVSSLYIYQTGEIGKLDNAKCWRGFGVCKFPCMATGSGVAILERFREYLVKLDNANTYDPVTLCLGPIFREILTQSKRHKYEAAELFQVAEGWKGGQVTCGRCAHQGIGTSQQ